MAAPVDMPRFEGALGDDSPIEALVQTTSRSGGSSCIT